MEEITIREMSRADLPEVLKISDQSFTTPWSSNSFEYEIGNRDSLLKVAENSSGIVGYICVRSFLDAVHIMDLAVLSGSRRKGTGALLLNGALREIKKTYGSSCHVTLEVRESNSAALNLYEKAGFTKTGRRKNYYKDPLEDGIIMGVDLK